MVVVRHYNGLETLYAHLDKLCVKPGQMLHAGEVIGQTGKSGNAKDYILHFETRFMNEFFDPNLMIRSCPQGRCREHPGQPIHDLGRCCPPQPPTSYDRQPPAG